MMFVLTSLLFPVIASAVNLCDPLFAGRSDRKESGRKPAQNGPRWEMIWNDEFDGTGLPDPAKWSYFVNDKTTNAEKQYYVTAGHPAARRENGILFIEARAESYRGRAYTSARLDSVADWTYGRFEFRSRNPVGKGLWPAIWMMPRKMTYGTVFWPHNGELDLMEATGKEPNLITHAVFSRDDNFWDGRKKYVKLPVPTADSEFHDYAMEWLPGRIDFFIDGKKTYSDRQLPGEEWTKWPFNHDFHLIMNLAVGGTLGGPVDVTKLPAKLEVDYMRVYRPLHASDCIPEISH